MKHLTSAYIGAKKGALVMGNGIGNAIVPRESIEIENLGDAITHESVIMGRVFL